MTWKRPQQEFYMRTTIGMAGLIIRRNQKSQGDCVDDWYFKNQKTATDEMLETMRQYPDYHPQGVILAFVEKRCGSAVYKN